MDMIDKLKDALREHHADSTQRQYTALAAVEALKNALHALAQLGHRFDIVKSDGLPPIEWPKMFYHGQHGSLVVHSQEAADNLSPGWQDKPIGYEENQKVAEVKSADRLTATIGENSGPKPIDIADAMARGLIAGTPTHPDEHPENLEQDEAKLAAQDRDVLTRRDNTNEPLGELEGASGNLLVEDLPKADEVHDIQTDSKDKNDIPTADRKIFDNSTMGAV